MCHQAVAQYPVSIDDHKDTLRTAPRGTAIVPVLGPDPGELDDKNTQHVELAKSEESSTILPHIPLLIPQTWGTDYTPPSIMEVAILPTQIYVAFRTILDLQRVRSN